jgi:hypothetical protein
VCSSFERENYILAVREQLALAEAATGNRAARTSTLNDQPDRAGFRTGVLNRAARFLPHPRRLLKPLQF